MARDLFNAARNMKSLAVQHLTRPQILRMIPSPLVHLFSHDAPSHKDPPEVRAAWLRLYWEIMRKPKRNALRKD